MAYEWRNNNACRATYKVLTDEDYGQLRADSVPFEQAGTRTMGSLPMFNHTLSSSRRMQIGRLRAREFLAYLQDIHPLIAENPNTSLDEILDRLATVFTGKTKSVTDLAEAVDAIVKFPDEVAA